MYYIEPSTKQTSEAISLWKYEKPYSIYSMSSDEETLKELMNGEYYSVWNENRELIGYFCFGTSARVPGISPYGAYDEQGCTDIGLGIRPDLTGMGLGAEFVKSGIEMAREKLKAMKIRLTVAEFNIRAIKVYEKVGFKKVAVYTNKNHNGERNFIIMTLD